MTEQHHIRTSPSSQVAGLRYAFSSAQPAAQRLGRVVLDDGRELGVQYTGDVIVATNQFMGLVPAGDGCA
jgi:hypothetical protein